MLQLEGIRAGYSKTQVLHGVDLVVPEGSAVGLLGANGAGKTTLLRVAAGLMAPGAGSVRFDGEPVEGLSRPARSPAVSSRCWPSPGPS